MNNLMFANNTPFGNYLSKIWGFLIFIFLLSCSNDENYINKPVNNYGGFERNSSYEFLRDFYSYSAYIDYPRERILSGAIQQPLALPEDKIITATSDGSIFCLEDNKKVLWEFKLDSGIVVSAGMCADAEGNIYAICTDHTLYSVSKDGQLRWKYRLLDSAVQFPIFSDLLCTENGVYLASNFGLIARFSFAGERMWEIRSKLSAIDCFSATLNGSIVVPITHNSFGASDTLLYINPNGQIKWKRALEYVRVLKHPAIYENIIALPGVFDSNGVRIPIVMIFDTLGNLLWKRELPVQPRYVSVSQNKEIYVVGNNPSVSDVVSGVFCFSGKGELRWKLYIDMLITHPVLIGKEKLAVSGFKSGAVATHILKREDGKLIKTISLNKFPILLLKPTVAYNSTIVFVSSQELCFVRVDDLFINKIIPW